MGHEAKALYGRRAGAVVTAAAAIALCLPAVSLLAQHQNAPRPAPRYSNPRSPAVRRTARPQPRQGTGTRQNQNELSQAAPAASKPNAPQAGARGALPKSRVYNTPEQRDAYPSGTAQQLYAPPGHLGRWLNHASECSGAATAADAASVIPASVGCRRASSSD